ncbi:MAG TPA: hypothetical protein VM553_03735 [Dongiaceae bacterium]|nr:hypothetical protein [Dongiaceae bacterium]
MSALDYVHAFEASDVGQFFLGVDSSFVVLFQLLHIGGFLLLLTAALLLVLNAFGALWVVEGQAQQVRGLYRAMLYGLILASVSGAALFATSATHYFTNKAMPVKMILLLSAALASWIVLKKGLSEQGAPSGRAKVAALAIVTLWFATGFAGRAIGFV